MMSIERRGHASDRCAIIVVVTDQDGFTLTELLIAFTVVAALSAIAVPQFASYRRLAENVRAVEELRTLDTSIQLYQMVNASLPGALTEVPGGNILDPWGNPYQYLKVDDTKAVKGKARKDKFLVPINSDYDLYSMGPDGKSVGPLTAKASQDDIIRANDGGYFGLAADY